MFIVIVLVVKVSRNWQRSQFKIVEHLMQNCKYDCYGTWVKRIVILSICPLIILTSWCILMFKQYVYMKQSQSLHNNSHKTRKTNVFFVNLLSNAICWSIRTIHTDTKSVDHQHYILQVVGFYANTIICCYLPLEVTITVSHRQVGYTFGWDAW